MKKVIVDFEMNPIAREHKSIRKQYKQEIIEIGAIMLDEDMNEIATFKTYVKPSYSKKIELKITELTGIETYHINGAKRIDEVLNEFANWCVEMSGNDFSVYAWSENDLNQINKEIELNAFEVSAELNKVIDSWFDLQFEYDNAIGSQRTVGLTKALESLGIFFEGKMHDALDDSRNTAIIYRELQNPEKMLETINEIKSMYTPVEQNVVTLGDLFDFSQFICEAV